MSYTHGTVNVPWQRYSAAVDAQIEARRGTPEWSKLRPRHTTATPEDGGQMYRHAEPTGAGHAHVANAPSDKQLDYIRSMASKLPDGKLDGIPVDGPDGLINGLKTRTQAGALIEILIRRTRHLPRPRPVAARRGVSEDVFSAPHADEGDQYDDVPDGYYALRGDDDSIAFYRVSTMKARPEAGYPRAARWVTRQHSDDMARLTVPQRSAVLARVREASPDAAGALYGVEIGQCWVCHRTLTSEARKRGIGDTCASKRG